MRRLATLAVMAAVAAGCTKGGEAGPAGATGPSAAFANALGSNFLNLSATPKTIASITFNAPSSGSVVAIATGYCNLNQAPNVVYAQIEGTADTLSVTPLQNLFIIENTSTSGVQFPFTISKTFNGIPAGPITLYLNARLAIGSSTTTNCQTNMTVFFTTSTL